MSVPEVTPWCSRGPRGCRCSAPPLPVRSGRLLDAMPDRYRALHQQCGLMPTRSRWIKTPDKTSGCRRIVLGVDVDHDARTLSETDPPDNDVESSVEWERDPRARVVIAFTVGPAGVGPPTSVAPFESAQVAPEQSSALQAAYRGGA